MTKVKVEFGSEQSSPSAGGPTGTRYIGYAGLCDLPWLNGLDAGISAWVNMLRAHRVETYESCEGGDSHSYPEPTIAFGGGPGAGFHALSVAMTHGLPVSELRRIWTIVDGEPSGPNWNLVFTRAATPDESNELREALEFERGSPFEKTRRWTIVCGQPLSNTFEDGDVWCALKPGHAGEHRPAE